MTKIVEVCETKKILPKLKQVINGKGLVIGREVDKVNDMEFINKDVFVSQGKEDFDYVVLCDFPQENKGWIGERIDGLIRKSITYVRPNGFLVVYAAHSHYCPYGHIPQNVLLSIKHFDDIVLEIMDFQTFGFSGAYGIQNHENVEYAFYVVLKKANSLFKVKDLADDPGQMMSLDD